MKVAYSLQFLLAGWSVLTGFVLGWVYEHFRLLHRLHPHAVWLIFLEDLLFCLMSAVGLTVLFFNLSYGRMRLYAFLGFAGGFACWYFTVGRLFRRMLSRLDARVRPHLRYARMVCYTKRETRRFTRRARNGFSVLKCDRRRSRRKNS